MRVLVTRPMPAAQRTAAELARRGHEPVLLPLTQAEHRLETLRPAPPPETTALAVSSAEAIRALAALPDGERCPYLDLPVFAVGQTTAAAARELGFRHVETGTGDGEALARLLLATLSLEPTHPILYLAGHPRSPEFEQRMSDASRPMQVRECYRMVPISWNPVAMSAKLTPLPDCVLLYSSDTARQFTALLSATGLAAPIEKSFRFLCLSHKIAATLPEEFQTRAVWSMEPREDLLLDLI
ncbi:MAG: uroporphyrinogen-III synthase [Rhizobium sp.]|nr:uroporphyrinogen-III synthase [Rhizobium sp.]